MREVLLRPVRVAFLAAATGLAAAAMAPAAHAAEPWGFEQVTPPHKGGAAVSSLDTFRPSQDGNAFLLSATGPFEGLDGQSAPRYSRMLAVRGSGSWSNIALDPPWDRPPGGTHQAVMLVIGSSEDLSHVLISTPRALLPEATEGGTNLYVKNTRTGALQLVLTGASRAYGDILVGSQGAVAVSYVANDGRTVIFTSDPVLPSAPVQALYRWTADSGLEPVSVLPVSEGGGIVPGNLRYTQVGTRNPISRKALEDDRIYFFGQVDPFSEGSPLYVRSGGQTQLISYSRMAGGGAPVETAFDNWGGVSADGRYVVFAPVGWNVRLTDDTPDVPGVTRHVYRYDAETDDLEYVVTTSIDTFSGVIQVSDDGQTIVVQSGIALTGDATEGVPNLYVWRNGTVQHVTAGDANSVRQFNDRYLRLLSPSGRYLAFTDDSVATAAAAGVNNISTACAPEGSPTGRCTEVYRYDAVTDELDCASCRIDGGASTGHSGDPGANGPGFMRMDARASRTVVDDGSVFFTTANALAAGDNNGGRDAYAWSDDGPRLLSRGTPGTRARFLDATDDGKSVFFSTNDRIVPTDVDNASDVYLTRAGAGYPDTRPILPPPCTGANCRDLVAGPPPALPPIGSIGFAGDGNTSPMPNPVSASVSVARLKAAIGPAAKLRVRVPGAGRISVAGASIRRSMVSASRAGSYSVRIALSAKAKRSLKKTKKLKVGVRVSYRSKSGQSASKRVSITFRQPQAKRAEPSNHRKTVRK